jgi:hypothetical protein
MEESFKERYGSKSAVLPTTFMKTMTHNTVCIQDLLCSRGVSPSLSSSVFNLTVLQ